jgi:TolB-like protein
MPICKKFLTCLLSVTALLLAQKTEVISLAVSDLAAQGVKESEVVVISEQLRVELMKSPRIRLIERSQMQAILKEQGFQQSGCTSDACAVEVGQLLGVRNMVIGSVGMAGSYTVLSARVIDVGTGTVVVNESVKTKGGIDEVLESGIRDVTAKLTKGLFVEPVESKTVAQPKVKGKPGRAIFIGGGTAVLVGGGIAAAILLSRDGTAGKSLTPNTRIDLP